MGCDIHLIAEKLVDGKWVCLSQMERSEDDGENISLARENLFYDNRNYDVFAILADVRNGRGFAGVKTGDGFKPIADPRGVPDDCSPEYREWAEKWDCDGHSHSYFTVLELLTYDWTQVVKQMGQQSLLDYIRWSVYRRDYGLAPDDYAGDIGGRAIRKKVNMDEADEIIKKMLAHFECQELYQLRNKLQDDEAVIPDEFLGIVVRINWTEPYYRAAEDFLASALPKLLKECDGDFNSVRICFFFDN